MDGNDNRPRARRREDREAQKREKLSSFLPRKDGEVAEPAAGTQEQQKPAVSRRESAPGAAGPRRDNPACRQRRAPAPRHAEWRRLPACQRRLSPPGGHA